MWVYLIIAAFLQLVRALSLYTLLANVLGQQLSYARHNLSYCSTRHGGETRFHGGFLCRRRVC